MEPTSLVDTILTYNPSGSDPRGDSNVVKRDGWTTPGCGSKKEPHSCWVACHHRTGEPRVDHTWNPGEGWCYMADDIGRAHFCLEDVNCSGGDIAPKCRSEKLEGGGCSST